MINIICFSRALRHFVNSDARLCNSPKLFHLSEKRPHIEFNTMDFLNCISEWKKRHNLLYHSLLNRKHQSPSTITKPHCYQFTRSHE